MIRRTLQHAPIAGAQIGLLVLVATVPAGLGYMFHSGLVAVLSLGLALMGGAWLALELTRPLRELRARAIALALRHGATAAIDTRGGNEVFDLRSAFTAMTESMERDRRRLELAHQEAIERSRQLARSEQEARDLAMVASRTHSAVIITDASGLVLWVNEGFTRLAGYTLEDVRGRKPGSLLQGAGTDPATVAMMRERLTLGLGFHCEILNYARDGREYWLDVEVQPIYDTTGRIEKFMAVELDITDRKLKEQALTQAEEFLDSVVENIPAMVFVKDAGNLSYQRINRAAENILGIPRDSFVGKTDHDFFDTAIAARYIAQDRVALHAAEPMVIESDDFVGPDGELRSLLTRKLPIRDKNGTPRYLLGISEDVTESRRQQAQLRQATEDALAASRAKSQFLANMSHEIRTPMNGVLGMTELLLGTALDDRQRRFAETAYRSGEALLEIINDILDFSKIEAGRMELQPEEFVPAMLVEEIGELLAPRARAKGIALACRIEGELPPALLGDAGRIRQVLVNLMGNAVKFTERGEVLLRVQAAACTEATHCDLRFSVRDTGIGMAPMVQERLFRVFEPGSSSTTKRYGGTGLGLAISQHLVQLMGGQITVQSSAGAGSTFEFSLRLDLGTQPQAAAPAPVALSGARILVVEDNPTNRGILAQQLRNRGADCVAVEQGFAALDALDAAASAGKPFEVALIDMKMPGMSGIDLAGRIKRSPHLSATRLALLTSLSGAHDAAHARTAGIDLYLEKPLRQAELEQALRKLLAQRIAPAAVATASGNRVLVVEDNPVNSEIACTMLEQLGYEYAVAENGREALEQLGREAFDLALMDCQMPEMDGFEAVGHIRAGSAAASGAALPVIALTANALAGDRERCMEAGFNDYLSKPFSEGDLRAILARWLPQAERAPGKTPSRQASAAPAAAVTRPTRPAAVQTSPLDAHVVSSLRAMEQGGAPGLLSRLTVAFLASAPPLFDQLKNAAARGDMPAARLAAHTLKSSNANIGALTVSKLFAQIEADARHSEVVSAASRLDEAEREFRRVIDAVKTLAPA